MILDESNAVQRICDNSVNVLLCSSELYAKYMSVTIASIIEFSNDNRNYDILIFNKEIKDETKERIKQMVKEKTNISVRFVKVSGILADYGYNYRDGYSEESFYRVLAPYILANYEKILYFDSDVVVNRDIAELFDVDINNYYCAAARDPDAIMNCKKHNMGRDVYIKEVMGLSNEEDYIQSGVLLLNLSKIRDEIKIEKVLQVASSPKLTWGDQDAINILFQNKIRHIGLSWNTIVDGYGGRVDDINIWAPEFIKEEYMAARANPFIIHYGGMQPWIKPDVDMNGYFWKIAPKSPFFEEIKNIANENKNRQIVKKRIVTGYKYAFSVIIPVYKTEEYLEETIDSVINQSIGFEKYIQVILVNNNSPDNSDIICKKYVEKYPNNIDYLELSENIGPNGARVEGLKTAKGKYVNFLDSDDKWEADVFEKVFDFFEKNYYDIDFVTCRIHRFGAEDNWAFLDYKFDRDRIVDIECDYDNIVLSLGATFVKHEVFDHYSLDVSLNHAEDSIFLSEVVLSKKRYGILRDAIFHYRKRVDGRSAVQTRDTDLSWYFRTTEDGYLKLIEKSTIDGAGMPPLYIQYYLACEMEGRINTPIPDSFTEDQRCRYLGIIKKILASIEDFIIIEQKNINRYQKMLLLSIRDDKFWDKIDVIRGNLKYNNLTFLSIQFDPIIQLNDLVIENNQLVLSGYICIPLPHDRYDIVLIDNYGRKHELDINDEVNRKSKYFGFGKEYYSKRLFRKTIQIGTLTSFRFIMVYKGYYLRAGVELTKRSKLSWINDLFYCNEGTTITFSDGEFKLSQFNRKREIKAELHFYRQLFKRKEYPFIGIRLLARFYRLINDNKIWLLCDRGVKAGDNAEYLFEYLSQNPIKGIKCYYIVSKEHEDYRRIRKIGKVINYKSLKHKILFLLSDKIISSMTNDWVGNLYGRQVENVKDLYRFKQIHLQHGVIKDNLSSDIDKQSMGLSAIITSSSREKQSILDLPYGYDENQLPVTGLCRFDKLYRESKKRPQEKIILIAPTWRHDLAGKVDEKTDLFGYNPLFKKSEYFDFFNKLINNEKLLDAMNQYGFKGIFLIHPAIISQIVDFQTNDTFSLSVSNDDNELLLKSSLLVTDYSSIAFDFGFMERPVVYSQFDKESFYKSHTYEEGYYDYDKDGFGPVCENLETTIRTIIDAMATGCIMSPFYTQRVELFFDHMDDNNTSRVYDYIKNNL